MEYFSVKNWDDFQHYRDRAPPWIKLYNHLLDDYEFGCLQDASKLHLMLIWLLASRNNNKLPLNPMWIQQRLGVDSSVDLLELIEAGFLVEDPTNPRSYIDIISGDSSVLASCQQVATTEERESRGEREGEQSRGEQTIVEKSASVVQEIFEFWKQALKKTEGAKLTDKRSKKIKARLKDGYSAEQIKRAILGCSFSAFHRGENETSTVYDDLELICRDGAKLEFFWQFCGEDGNPPQSKADQENEDFLADGIDNEPWYISDEKVIN